MRSYGTKIENTLNPNLKDTDGLKYRLGEPGDILPIAATLLKEKMNPLSLDHERFIVCETASGERVGFGQVRPLASSKEPDSLRYNAPPGSEDLEAEADDAAWDDFEKEWDSSGLKGLQILLPWTPGYRRFERRVALQRERRRARVSAAYAQAEPLWELASIYVEEPWRGLGVGTKLVQKLLQRHTQRGCSRRDLYLITIESRCRWYERLGFERVDKENVPSQMRFEIAVGEVISSVLGNRLVCMRGRDAGE